ncbi:MULTISPECIES: aspartyl-phosphate phosphatase Spo0E family protein [Paenibacillus]
MSMMSAGKTGCNLTDASVVQLSQELDILLKYRKRGY